MRLELEDNVLGAIALTLLAAFLITLVVVLNGTGLAEKKALIDAGYEQRLVANGMIVWQKADGDSTR